MKIKAYGSRASIPFFSRDGTRVGGNTSCFRLDVGGHIIILDCGTGIMQFHADILKERSVPSSSGRELALDILISHLHLDHIIGLSMFNFLLDKTNKIRIFTRSRGCQPISEQVFGIFKPPYWPIDLAEKSCAQLIEIKGSETFAINEDINVKTFDSMHDNDTTGFRVYDKKSKKTAVYLLDYEITDASTNLRELAEFCKNADVVVFDATYLPEDYDSRRGWGHSTYESGVMLAEMSNCKRMVFSHFFHVYTDETLDTVIDRVKRIAKGNTEYFMAYDGMELEL